MHNQFLFLEKTMSALSICKNNKHNVRYQLQKYSEKKIILQIILYLQSVLLKVYGFLFLNSRTVFVTRANE